VTARGDVPQQHQAAILRAKTAKEKADRAYADAIRAAAEDGATIRPLAEFLGIAPNTVRKILNR
jgi:hypothetical protein